MKSYVNDVYKDWLQNRHEDELVVRGRIISILNGKARDVWILSSDRRCKLYAPKSYRKLVYKGDIIAVRAQVNQNGEHWIHLDNCMMIKKATSLRIRSQIKTYAQNDSFERRFYCFKLLNDEASLAYIHVRSIILGAVRSFLEENKYIEMPIPSIQRQYYGGNAFPFITYVNYLHKNCYLKPNSQIPFLSCLAGGIERMYEISEYYRNGGVDKDHTVPYTAIEIVTAYSTYEECKDIVYKMLDSIAFNLEKACIPSVDRSFIDRIRSKNLIDFRNTAKNSHGCEYDCLMNDMITYEQSKALYDVIKHKEIVGYDGLSFLDYLPDSFSPFIKKVDKSSNYLLRGYAIINGVNIVEYFEGETDLETVVESLEKSGKNAGNNDLLTRSLELGIPQYTYITISIDRIITYCIGKDNLQDVRPQF